MSTLVLFNGAVVSSAGISCHKVNRIKGMRGDGCMPGKLFLSVIIVKAAVGGTLIHVLISTAVVSVVFPPTVAHRRMQLWNFFFF